MAVHYPLNGIDLDFNRYEHRPLGPRDIMVNRIMEDYMNSRRVKRPNTYLRGFDLRKEFKPIKSRDRELGLDMYVLSRVLETRPPQFYIELELYWLQSLAKVATPMNLSQAILGLVERHHLESDPSVRLWLKQVRRFYPAKDPSWKKDMAEHLKRYQSSSAAHYHHFLYSGGHCVPIDPPSYFHLSIHPNFLGPPWLRVARRIPLDHSLFTMFAPAESPFRMVECLHQGKPRRPCSMPPPGAWSTTAIEADSPLTSRIIYFPRRPLSELDKISRRRSLSRTHIRAMFTDKPKWTVKDPDKSGSMVNAKNPCGNCGEYTHFTFECVFPCGYCKSPGHQSRCCTVKANNRCKCRPHPQFHTASQCFVRCSRKCGSPYHPGHFKHKSAILCSHRCCMCGIRGHSGRQCSLKKCPCGEQHLTQDCRWKVECPAKNCDLYYCHLHCRECGKKKEKGSKDQFVGRTCQECLKNGKPLFAKAELPTGRPLRK